jgi:ABC-type multidrug transport system ATPase subunit
MNGKAAEFGDIQGEMLINGQKLFGDVEAIKDIAAFVPQSDTMYTDQTVRETLMFNARLRLPVGTNHAKIVEDVLDMINMKIHADKLIGSDGAGRVLSGGQIKRVNIGMELVSCPSVLFLDEPTSGLDSSASSQVADVLRSYSEQRTATVVVVLHQPKKSIFDAFDDVCLLVAVGRNLGGRMAFFGSPAAATEYFVSLGYRRHSHHENAADFYMDILEGIESRYCTLAFVTPFHVCSSMCSHLSRSCFM